MSRSKSLRAIRPGRGRSRCAQLAGVLGVCLVCNTSAEATWSIVAVDPDTHEVGVATASCSRNVANVVSLIPGHAAAVVQGRWTAQNQAQLETLLRQPIDPEEAVEQMIAEDSGRQRRQYGIVDLLGRGAEYSGEQLPEVAGSATEDFVAVLGNFLENDDLLESSLHAFLDLPAALSVSRAQVADNRILADRLMAALQAGMASGGDRRCGDDTALSAALVVACPTDPKEAPHIQLLADSNIENPNPVITLAAMYADWRANSPRSCVAQEADAAIAGHDDAGPGDATPDAATVDTASVDDATATARNPDGSNTTDTAAHPLDSATEDPLASPSDSGCGCELGAVRPQQPGMPAVIAAVTLLALGFKSRRRAR